MKIRNILSQLVIPMLVVLALLPNFINSQDLPEVIPPSPDAQAFQKYGDLPVSMYTGVPQISIPIYTISEGDISVPITLSYHASGIRVSEESSWVGLGWALNSGGNITRVIHGEGDIEHNYFSLNVPDITAVPPTNALSPYAHYGCDLTVPGIPNLCDYLRRSQDVATCAGSGTPGPQDDFEPDVFNFSHPSGSGKFVMSRNGQAILQNKEKNIIEFDFSAKTWAITDINGFTYEYDKYEQVKPNADGQLETISAWYLTKITSAKTNRFVMYNYDQDTDFDMITLSNVSESRNISACATDDYPDNFSTQNTYKNQTLSSIDFSNGRVLFIYDQTRADLPGGKRLLAIEVYQKLANGNLATTPLKKYDMEYGYFIGNNNNAQNYPHSSSDYLNKRLKLVSVTEDIIGTPSKLPPHKFEYYETFFTKGLPSKGSYAQDYWGYYNGRTGSNLLLAKFDRVLNFGFKTDFFNNVSKPGQNRGVDPLYAIAFSLKKLTYPTGGSSSFLYEPNDYDPRESNIDDFSTINFLKEVQPVSAEQGALNFTPVDLTNAKVEADGKVYLTIDYSFRCLGRSDCNPPNQSGCVGCEGNWSQDAGEDVFFSLSTSNSLSNEISGSRVRFTDDNFCYGTDFLCEREPRTFALDPGVYYFASQWADHVELLGANAELSFFYETSGNTNNPNINNNPLAGGLRIKEIIDNDGRGNKYSQRYEYNYKEDRDNDGIDEEYSYGRLMATPVDLRWQIDWNVNLLGQGYDSALCKKFVQTSNSNVPLNVNGAIVGYDQVTIYRDKTDNENFGRFGKTTYTYHNDVRLVPFGGTRLPGTPNININSNGLLKEQVDFKHVNNAYTKVREVTNTYDFDVLNFDTPPVSSDIIYGIKKRELDFNIPSSFCDNKPYNPVFRITNQVFLQFYPVMHSEWVRKIATSEKIYDSSSDLSFTETSTDYFYENAEHRQLTRTETTNSDGKLISTKTFYPYDVVDNSSLGAPSLSVGQLAALYNLRSPDPSFPFRQNRITEPVQTATTINGKTTTLRTLYQQENNGLIRPQFVQTLKDVISRDNEIQNRIEYRRIDEYGNPEEVLKTDGLSVHYIWGYNQMYPIAKIENATYSQISSLISSLQALSNTDNDRTIGSVGNEGALRNALDNLRNSLPDAMVSTYTYDPLIGATSMTDPKGYVTYYRYDELNRLMEVRDADNNIVTDYKYHYKGQTN